MDSTAAKSVSSVGPLEELTSGELETLQRHKLKGLLAEIGNTNAFYRAKLESITFDPLRDSLTTLPFTTRKELEADQLQHPPFGTNLTYTLERYTRYCQTSGTGGRPMRWLDTHESWAWVVKCWQSIYQAAGVRQDDRLIFPFSFGPFLGFWGAFDGAVALGCLAIPAGGVSTLGRLRMILDNCVTVVCCTPTYSLRMAEVARQEGIDLRSSAVRAIIVAGEPGGSILQTRQAIEQSWGATVFDHSGMTETGPMTFQCVAAPLQLHVIETEFIVEIIDPQTERLLPDGQTGELVVTNLGRLGSPLIRYRSGDLARTVRGRCECGRCLARLDGGILGRADDMIIVRGNNVFPTAIEAVLRGFAEIAEFRVSVVKDRALGQIRIELEPAEGNVDTSDLCQRVTAALQSALSFRAEVAAVAPGTLPRFEHKAARFVRERC